MKKIAIVVLIVVGTVGIVALSVGNTLYQFHVLLNCRTDFFCRPEPTIVPVIGCEELDQDSGLGYWLQQMPVGDPRTGGMICITSGSSATGSLLFAKEIIFGHSLESRHLWNANQTRIEGSPSVSTGPDGFLYLYIPVRVYYSGGSFTMIHGLLLSEELPVAADQEHTK